MSDRYTKLNKYLYQRPPQVGGLLIYQQPANALHSIYCYHIPIRPSGLIGGIIAEAPFGDDPITARNQSTLSLTKTLSKAITAATTDSSTTLIDTIHQAMSTASKTIIASTMFASALIADKGTRIVTGTSGNIDIYVANAQGNIINNGNPLNQIHYFDMQKTQIQCLSQESVMHETYQVEMFELEDDMRFIITLSTHWKEIYGADQIPSLIQQSLRKYCDFIHTKNPLHATLQTWGETIQPDLNSIITRDMGMIVIERPLYVELYQTKSFKQGTL